jgi:twitching motility protein PilT
MADHTVAWERFDDWLKRLLEMRGSDLHLVPGYKPRARVDGVLQDLDDLVLTREQTNWVATGLFGATHHYDPVGRTNRVLGGGMLADIFVSRAGGDITVSVRVHGGPIPSLKDIEAPDEITTMLSAPAGIIVVAGPHGSGKTTTLYSMADWINNHRNVHMCTVENPRWHLFEKSTALVQQHEVGKDGPDVASLLRDAMLKAPEVLMAGEVEDLETLATCITAAETGHLVLLHLNATSIRDAVERLALCAPPDMQPGVRAQLKQHLRGVMVQRLAKKQTKGRAPVYELVGEAAGKLAEGGDLDDKDYIAKAADRIQQLEDAGTITPDEVVRLRREFSA